MENPNTWSDVTVLIDEAIKQHAREMDEGTPGFSAAMKIENALVAAGKVIRPFDPDPEKRDASEVASILTKIFPGCKIAFDPGGIITIAAADMPGWSDDVDNQYVMEHLPSMQSHTLEPPIVDHLGRMIRLMLVEHEGGEAKVFVKIPPRDWKHAAPGMFDPSVEDRLARIARGEIESS